MVGGIGTHGPLGEPMTDDEAISAGWHKGWLKKRRKTRDEYVRNAKEEYMPFCKLCFNRDYPDLKNWKFYTEMKLIKEHKVVQTARILPTYGQYEGVHRDYVCTHEYPKIIEGKGGKITQVNVKCPMRLSLFVPALALPEDYFKPKKVPK